MTISLTDSLRSKQRWFWWGLDALTVVSIGVIAGLLWRRLVSPPAYSIDDDFRATIGQVALATQAGMDVYFALIGLVGGAVIGLITWFFIGANRWWMGLVAVLGASLAGLIAAAMGMALGPTNFLERVAAATKGDLVPVDFTIHSWVPWLLWPGMAAVPVLIGSLIKRERWINYPPMADASSQSSVDGSQP
ncbi:MAG: hypothetical protein LBV30_06630 [Propionibacteriaceae bacterium]|jgi:hypothetical protein|nr:hypothetical protein [Propionibacteriaceae bacterium]